jgi:hypothetical protein
MYFRKHWAEDTPFDHQRDGGRRVGKCKQLQQLVGNPLPRESHQVVGSGSAGFKRWLVHLLPTEPGVKAEEAKDPEMIFGDSSQRITDEAHPPRLKVPFPIEIVEHC